MKIKKDDKVKILSGKDKGKIGKVLQVLPDINRVVVEDINKLVKHMRPRRRGEKGQKIEFPNPLAVSKVALVCPKCNQKVRVGYRFSEILSGESTGRRKNRFCRKCKETF